MSTLLLLPQATCNQHPQHQPGLLEPAALGKGLILSLLLLSSQSWIWSGLSLPTCARTSTVLPRSVLLAESLCRASTRQTGPARLSVLQMGLNQHRMCKAGQSSLQLRSGGCSRCIRARALRQTMLPPKHSLRLRM